MHLYKYKKEALFYINSDFLTVGQEMNHSFGSIMNKMTPFIEFV